MIIYKSIEVDYGHTLPKHNGFCNQLHGHRGKVEVGFTAENLDQQGMIVDFGFIKKILMEKIHSVVDHAFIVWENDTDKHEIKTQNGSVFVSTLEFVKSRNEKILVTEEQPTAEYLAKWSFFEIYKALRDIAQIKIVSVKWWETPNNVAEFTYSDLKKMYVEETY